MERDSFRGWAALGALYGLIAVAAAAGAAHLRVDPVAERALASAVQMNGWHALALIGCGLWGGRGGRMMHAAAGAFALGALLFCGSVYLSVFGAHLGPVAPVGGALLMLGWALFGLAALRR